MLMRSLYFTISQLDTERTSQRAGGAEIEIDFQLYQASLVSMLRHGDR